jgi:hypothetical protein
LALLLAAQGTAWANETTLNGEQRMREEAIAKVQSRLGPESAPASAAASPQNAAAASTFRKLAAAANTGYRCLPSCDPTDGRFLAIAGANFQTLSPPELSLEISVPAGTTAFQIGVFDGDGGEYQSDGFTAFWDSGNTALFEYSLAADPDADATGTVAVDLAPGQPVIYSNTMPDNGWADFTITPGPEALTPSGNYFYVLRIRLVDVTATTLNAFKVRSSATISGSTLSPVARPFSYIAPWTALDDILVIYPQFPSPTPTTYDGTFTFFMDVPTSQPELAIWDGDFDHGNFTLTDQDTDDPDTPNAPFTPSWSTAEVVPEGVATGVLGSTGNPSDDDNTAGFGAFIVRSPAVHYDLLFPDGQTFANPNPSGNQEWEQLKISTAPFDSSQMDYSTSVIPPGTYELKIHGVDMLNLNALLLPFRVLCVDELGVPCQDIPRPFRVGDTVFADRDGDGVQGAGEPGIPGVVLALRDAAGALIRTATTDADGHYSFEVEAGEYRVEVAAVSLAPGGALDGYISTTADQRTDTVAGDNVLTYDFGYRGNGSLGDRLWLDRNGDGVQDAGEAGLNGVTVRLLSAGGAAVATATTGGDGGYTFDHLPAGSYTVRVDAATLPSGLSATYDLDGVATLNETAVTLAAGAHRTDVDFGYRGSASLGDRVWYDINANGAQDTGERGLNGVTVELLDADGHSVAATVTAGDGGYSFAGLLAGSYTVHVLASTLPGDDEPTFDADGTATPDTAAVTLADGQARTDVDFGYRGTGALGDRVWYDINANGVQDADEVGINGATVQLLDSLGNVLASTATAGNGGYSFAGLLPGTYGVRVLTSTLPGGAVATFDLDGIATPSFALATVANAQNLTTVDFGYRGTASLGDRVWFDYDGNGVQDSGEPGINGVTVELRDSSGALLATTTTAGNGNYTFSNLPAGTYTVTVVAATLPGGAVPTYDLDGAATAHTAVVTLTAGQSRTDVDFGYRGTASLGDRVWLDYDADGVQDAGEVGINSVGIQLLDANGTVIAAAATAGNGNYTFSNLLAGTYKIRVVTSTLAAGSVQTYDLDGTATASLATASVTGGQSRTDADFGYRMTPPGTATIGYWKTHAEAWPVATVTVGGVVYTRDQAIALIGTPSRGDKSIDLFKQLAAAKLNLIAGNNPSCIYSTIASADAWMAAHPPGSSVGASSATWTTASPWHTALDDYNNGQLCAPHRN